MYTILLYGVHVKGITQQLRDLALGEQIKVKDVERNNLHHIAGRLGIKIQVEKFIGGFAVTRVPNGMGVTREGVAIVSENFSPPADERQAKLAALRAMMESPTKSVVSEPEETCEFRDIQRDEQRDEYYAIVYDTVARKLVPSKDPKWAEDVSRVMRERGLE